MSAAIALPASWKSALRRSRRILVPDRESREYRAWRSERLKRRALLYQEPVQPGLLSVLTAVWDGSPLRYLKRLAEAIAGQNQSGACEWVVLDNGCRKPPLRSYLNTLGGFEWVKLLHSDTNAGISKGLRACLEGAASRYVLPVDADDLLSPDAFRILTAWIRNAGYPPLLYTDEDKIVGRRYDQPYMKPDWDPVLLLNSAYIAHLGVMDRKRALELGVYADPKTEGSPDWDAFMRFLIAGERATHVPEVLYSWRAHARSTADHAATKPYVLESQKAVLQRFLDALPDGAKFQIEYTPLAGGLSGWHFSKRDDDARAFGRMAIGLRPGYDAPARAISQIAEHAAERGFFVEFVGEDVRIEGDWRKHALAVFELHPEVVMIGGRIRNSRDVILEAGRHFGYGGVCGCPDRGRTFSEPGYFAHLWKQRSVSAVATQFAVIRASFLCEALRHAPESASIAFLGAWAGAQAMRTGRHIAYSPWLSGVSELDWQTLISAEEQELFARANHDLIPDRRFYSPNLSLERPFAFGTPFFFARNTTAIHSSAL